AGGVLPTPNASVLYWGGYGGSLAVIDMENRAAFGYAMNRMESTTTGDVRAVGLVMGMWGALAG
ncbi:MAG: serine hydrolase, partial [Phenylobacterium sp.]|nr:serine hydrolase [Phenylobacterium sp.]